MRFLATEPRSIVVYIRFSVSLWNDLRDPVCDGVGLAGFKNGASASLLTLLLANFLAPPVFPFSSFIQWVGIVGLGSSGCGAWVFGLGEGVIRSLLPN